MSPAIGGSNLGRPPVPLKPKNLNIKPRRSSQLLDRQYTAGTKHARHFVAPVLVWLRLGLLLYRLKGIEEVLQLCRVGAVTIFQHVQCVSLRSSSNRHTKLDSFSGLRVIRRNFNVHVRRIPTFINTTSQFIRAGFDIGKTETTVSICLAGGHAVLIFARPARRRGLAQHPIRFIKKLY
jgi:hypothetical protein